MIPAVFILNPAAGHGRAAGVWEACRDAALRALPGAVCLRTERRGHAAQLARKALEDGARRLVAVGGDGTFGEMLEGVMGAAPELRRAAALAALPAGSGCDLARHLNYPRGAAEVVELIASGRSRAVDVGRIDYSGLDGKPLRRHFINMASFGLAGDVAHHIHRMGKFLGGTLSYAVSSGWILLTARAKALRLEADGSALPGRYHLGVVANTSSIGGGMLVAPGAEESDGKFDLVLVADMSRLKLWKNFPRLYRGTHLREPGITLRRISRLRAESDETVYLNIDGEADGKLPAVIEML
ncbi:MAG TPA: hypothetical protein DCZ92_08415, partial [Elusimicrobia bacterium]|nr:hypothetical protein [Elusimicrobiota bacterium]